MWDRALHILFINRFRPGEHIDIGERKLASPPKRGVQLWMGPVGPPRVTGQMLPGQVRKIGPAETVASNEQVGLPNW